MPPIQTLAPKPTAAPGPRPAGWRRALVALAGVLAATWVQAAVPPAYRVTDLGDFFPTGVNDHGWVSGYDGDALLWRPGVGLTDLGSFGVPLGAVSNRAQAINNAGQVVGYTWSTSDAAYRAFLWQDGSGLVDLGDLPGGGATSRADAVNALGVAAGRGAGQFSGHPSYGFLSFNHAVRFDAPGALLHLEAHGDATLNSIVRGINDAGVTAGERQTSTGWRAIVWDGDGAPLDLGAAWGLTGTGAAAHSFARDINNHGQVALQLPLGGTGFGAAVWQAGAGFTVIGQVAGFNAGANAINDDGVVVGTAGAPGAAGQQAFVWSGDAGLQSLTSLVDVDAGGGWLILDATGISDSGLIVGRGWHPNWGYRGVLLSPVPELPSALLAAAGLLLLVLRVARPPGWVPQPRLAMQPVRGRLAATST